MEIVVYFLKNKVLRKDNRVTGIILAGGKSSRFGSDKALAKFQDKQLIEYAVEVISPLTDHILISANSTDYDFLNIPVVADIYPEAGPLGGLHAALSSSKSEVNLVITTDTPFMVPELYNYLLSRRKKEQITLAASADGFIHPLCGIYSKDSLPVIREFLDNGIYKMMQLVKACDLAVVSIHPNLDFYSDRLFDNMNRPEDLHQKD